MIKPIPQEVQNLLSALFSGNKEIRLRAAKVLGEIGNSSAVPILIEAFGDKDRDLRLTA